MEYLGPILLTLLNVILTGFLLYYLSYFKRKGENLATKEDIEELTEITEKIKSEVAVLSQNRVSLYNEKRNSVLSFLESFNSIESFLVFKVNGGMSKDELMQNYIDKFDKDHHLADIKLRLFFNDPKLDSLLDEFEDLTLKAMKILVDIHERKLVFKGNSDISRTIDEFDKLHKKVLEYFRQFITDSTS